MFQPELETLPRPQLKALQDERLRHLVAYLYERVPFYRQRFQERGLSPERIQRTEDLLQLPFTRKQDLRDHYPLGLLAVPKEELARIHASSGTTGKPTIAPYTRRDLEVFAEVVARSLAAGGAKPGMLLHNAYGYGLFTGGLGLHGGAERLGLCVIPASGGVTERQLLLINDLKPEILACTPSYAQTLAEGLARQGLEPEAISLKYAILGAEPWSETLRASIESGLGVKATNIYGLSEVIGPGIAQECLERQGSHLWEDHFVAEIVDPERGEPLPPGATGVLVLTPLTKTGMPLLRYWTGDLTYLIEEPCACGRTHRRIGPILGRTDDMLIVRGVNLYPSQLEELLKEFPEVAPFYQIVLRRPKTLDELELKVELKPSATSIDPQGLAERIVEKVRQRLGLTMQVSLLAPGQAPRSEGGKLRRILDERGKL
jgi:phenylacetate-CoA ligase